MSNFTVTGDNVSYSFFDPSLQTPLFVAEWITCAYPISDIYASSPRYLYYVLLVGVFFAQWHSWLANVFLGVVATYAGTASIEAFVLLARQTKLPPETNVTIPYIDPNVVPGNQTLSAIKNLVMGQSDILVQPAALDYDVDAVLAITVTAYLMMLPFHCWSSAVRASRARHLLMLLWNALMLAGTICSLILWTSSFDADLQYRFCYPTILDPNSVTSDGDWDPSLWLGDWNSTIWGTFSNFTNVLNMNENCLYPCFSTTQTMRKSNTLQVSLDTHKSPRTRLALLDAGNTTVANSVILDNKLANLMLAAIIVTTVIMIVLLLFLLPVLKNLTRVPIGKPKTLLWNLRKELFHVLWKEFIFGVGCALKLFWKPILTYNEIKQTSERSFWRQTWAFVRFWLDLQAIVVLLFAMILTPATIIVFVVWIEFYIHRDIESQETPRQVGQWSTIASVALVLISVLVLQLKYVIAPEKEVNDEIEELEKHLERLRVLAKRKRQRHDDFEQRKAAYRLRRSSMAATTRYELEGRTQSISPDAAPPLSPLHMMTADNLGLDPMRDMYTQTSPMTPQHIFSNMIWERKSRES